MWYFCVKFILFFPLSVHLEPLGLHQGGFFFLGNWLGQGAYVGQNRV